MHGGRATLHMCCVPLGLGRISTEGFSVQRRRRHGTSSAGKADKGVRSRDVAMEGESAEIHWTHAPGRARTGRRFPLHVRKEGRMERYARFPSRFCGRDYGAHGEQQLVEDRTVGLWLSIYVDMGCRRSRAFVAGDIEGDIKVS